MNRLKDWESRFVLAMNAERKLAFEWCKSDCATLMGASIRACHGIDHPALKELKRYKTKAGALKVIKSGGSIGDIVAKYFEEIHPIMVQTGDIGVISGDEIEAGCVVDNGRVIARDPDNGFYFLQPRSITRAFRV